MRSFAKAARHREVRDWLIECGGEIIWLPGYRIARGWELFGDSEPALHLFMDGLV